jgi:hypothetical protein
MGLDTSHDCWHGSYITFGHWRNAIAVAAGYAVYDVMTGHSPGRAHPKPTVMLDWGHLGTRAHLLGEWEETPSDPLLVLIVHADDEGWILKEQAAPLADRMEALLPLIPEDNGYEYRTRAERFIAGLRLAVERGESVVFH